MTKVHVYLNFDGQTEEAFNFYKSVFGGEFDGLQRFKEVKAEGYTVKPEEAERIMHVALPIGNGCLLMGSDISSSMQKKFVQGNGTYITLQPDSVAEATRLYNELSADGTIEVELQKMFWGDYYAAFADKFGVFWMVNCEDS